MTDKVLDQAIDWLIKLESSQHAPSVSAACMAWRQANPSHEARWQALQEAQACFPLARELPSGVAMSTLGIQGRRKAIKTLGLGILGLGVSGGALQQSPWRRSFADYSTSTGERCRFALADGSTVQLDSRSAMDVRLDSRERRIVLREGQVYVQTALDALQRPLCVTTAQGRYETTNAAFNLCQENGYTRLTVDQGSVAFQLPGQVPARAQAGQQWRIDRAGFQLVERPTFEGSAWVRGVLIARDMPLQAVLDQLGRQRAGWVGCDPAVAGLKISGVFQLDDTNNALVTLTYTLPVRLVWRTSLWVRIVPA